MAGKKYTVEIDTVVKGTDQVKELNEELEQTQEEQKGVAENSEEMSNAVDNAVGGAVGKFKKFTSAIGSAVKSLGVLKLAVAATGLGALLLIISSLKAAFTSTEEGQNKFSKLMNALGVITGNVIDVLASLGTAIIAVFENPKQAIKDFIEAFKKNIEVRIQSTIKLFGLLGSAVKKVFSGDFSGAMDDAVEASKTYVDVITGVEDTVGKVTNAVTGFIEETKKEIAVQNELSDLQADVDKRTREFMVERAQLEVEIAEARLKSRQQDKFSEQERLAFLEEAIEKTKIIFTEEERIASDRLEIIRERNKLSGSTKEDLLAEAEAEVALINLRAQQATALETLTTEQQAYLNSLRDTLDVKKQLKEIDDEFQEAFEEDFDAQIEAIDKRLDAEVEANKKAVQEKKRLYLADQKAQKESEQAKKAMAVGTAMAGLSALSTVFNIMAEMSADNFEEQKKYQIAGAITQGLTGLIGAWAGAFMTPTVSFAQIALGLISSALIIGTTAYNISKIKSTQPTGGGSPPSAGGGGGGGAVSSAPSFSMIQPLGADGAGITDTLEETTGGEPPKSYVVADDVTTQQELDRDITANASI